jgi:hypothetical protein
MRPLVIVPTFNERDNLPTLPNACPHDASHARGR